MARPLRTQLPDDGVFHVICRGNNKAGIFRDDDDFHWFLSLLADTKKLLPFALFHYTLMSNHVHLAIKVRNNVSLTKIMKRINEKFSRYHKRKYGYVGHLWQGRFKSLLIDSDAYLLTCGIYIELNPVRAGLVSRSEAYPWTSYRFYARGEGNALVDPNPLYETLGSSEEGRQCEYRQLAEMWIDLKKDDGVTVTKVGKWRQPDRSGDSHRLK
jgi:putative transposase